MKYFAKLFGIAVTIVTTIVGGIEWAEIRLDRKLSLSEKRLDQKLETSERHNKENTEAWRAKTITIIKAGDNLLASRISGLETSIERVDKNVRLILRTQLRQAADSERLFNPLYSKSKEAKGNETL